MTQPIKPSGPMKTGCGGTWKERPDAEDIAACCAGSGACQSYRDGTARLPFEQQQLDSEQYGGKRSGEGGGHTSGGPGDKQSFAFCAGEMKKLRDHRTEGAPGHDDGSFGAERAAGADRNSGRDGLQNGEARMNAAAVHQDGFNCFRNTMAADAFRSVTRHEPHYQGANHWNSYGEYAEMVAGW